MTRRYRIFCAAMAGVFLLSAAVQWNDPDPLRWTLFYVLAALAAFAAGSGAKPALILEAAVAAMALGVVIALLPALGGARVEAVTSMQMKSPEDELVRELGGAAIVLAFAANALLQRALRARGASSA